jgi:hypothetical protein
LPIGCKTRWKSAFNHSEHADKIDSMKAALILLALVVVLSFAEDAGAYSSFKYRDYTLAINSQRFGFADWCPGSNYDGGPAIRRGWTTMYAGPVGEIHVPFTAIQGLVGFCLIVVTLIALLITLTVRGKKKRVAH